MRCFYFIKMLTLQYSLNIEINLITIRYYTFQITICYKYDMCNFSIIFLLGLILFDTPKLIFVLIKMNESFSENVYYVAFLVVPTEGLDNRN